MAVIAADLSSQYRYWLNEWMNECAGCLFPAVGDSQPCMRANTAENRSNTSPNLYHTAALFSAVTARLHGIATISKFSPVVFVLFVCIRLSRVLKYSSTTRIVDHSSIFYNSSTRYFLFLVANFHFGLQFFCSQLMNCSHLWKRGASWFHLQLPAWKCFWIYTCRGDACSRPWPFGYTLNYSTFFVTGRLPVLTSTRV